MSAPIESMDPPQPRSGRGCLVAAGALAGILVALGALAYLKVQRSQREYERKAAERRTDSFNKVKSGNGGGNFSVLDPKLMVMLANDPDCIANVASLNLAMTDLGAPDFASASRLTNVTRIYVYSCEGADAFVAGIGEMPSVEEIGLEATRISDETVRRLPSVFPNLKKLRFAWGVDKDRAALLEKTLPGVQIEFPPPEPEVP